MFLWRFHFGFLCGASGTISIVVIRIFNQFLYVTYWLENRLIFFVLSPNFHVLSLLCGIFLLVQDSSDTQMKFTRLLPSHPLPKKKLLDLPKVIGSEKNSSNCSQRLNPHKKNKCLPHYQVLPGTDFFFHGTTTVPLLSFFPLTTSLVDICPMININQSCCLSST